MQKIVKGADQLVKLVNNLLDLSRIRAGQFKLNYDREDFTPIIEETISRLEELANEKRIAINARLQGPLVAEFDIRRMAQVLSNVLENAIKFTPEGGSVEIRGETEGPDMVIEVEDTGIGIAQENLTKIFERFTQVDMSTTREAGGTGLGKGSTICFSIPLENPHSPC